jgi:hypothetical protein
VNWLWREKDKKAPLTNKGRNNNTRQHEGAKIGHGFALFKIKAKPSSREKTAPDKTRAHQGKVPPR